MFVFVFAWAAMSSSPWSKYFILLHINQVRDRECYMRMSTEDHAETLKQRDDDEGEGHKGSASHHPKAEHSAPLCQLCHAAITYHTCHSCGRYCCDRCAHWLSEDRGFAFMWGRTCLPCWTASLESESGSCHDFHEDPDNVQRDAVVDSDDGHQ